MPRLMPPPTEFGVVLEPPPHAYVAFRVTGLPETKGSYIGLGGGRVKPDNPRERAWGERCAWMAKLAMRNKLIMTQGAMVALDFILPRPVGRKNQRDVDKLSRSCLDAMNRIVYIDDENVRCIIASKETTTITNYLGVEIVVFPSNGMRASDIIGRSLEVATDKGGRQG